MERKPLLQPEFNAGEAFLPLMASDEAFINGMYDGLSYQSLLSLSLHHNYYSGDVKPLHSPLVNDVPDVTASTTTQMKLTPATFDFSNPLKFPKLEQVTDSTNYNLQLYDPYSNNNNEIYLNDPYYNSDAFGYHRLPDLRCLEQPNYLDFHYGDTSSLLENRVEPVLVNLPSPKNSSAATRLRKKLSEKTRCLEKLLPWDTKMDTATMLEEAYKYVKFLQAQVSVLQSMPTLGGDASSEGRNGINEGKAISVYGRLGRLNRQQLLQVVLNSPVAQTYLYSKGCCVYSVEQLVQYKKIAQRNAFYHQNLFYSGMLS